LANGSTTLCIGDTVELYGSAVSDATYQWSINNLDVMGENALNLYALSSGNYALQTINSCGATASNIISISLDSLPQAAIVTTSGSTNFCLGDSVVLSGSILNGVQYQWTENGLDINGANAIDLTVNQSGIYTLNTINNCGVSSSNSITVTIDSLPLSSSVSSATSTTFCLGDSMLLNGSNINGATYQWLQNGNTIMGATSLDLYVSQTGIYALNTINACGVSTSNTLQVNAASLPPTPVISSSNDTLVTMGGYSYAWYLNGTLIPGALDSIYIATTTGAYEVVITSIDSCSSLSLPFNYVAAGIISGPERNILNLFPNPAQDVLNFQVKETGFYSIEIMSPDGKMVMNTQQILEQRSVLHLSSSIENGAYLIRIRNEKSEYLQRFILNR
ncbi:MAG: T9SS type A sorting domain-containing protein, partial [Bacteroidia bacterium]